MTESCRDARSERPLCQRLQHRGINGDGRTDRASLQDSVSVRPLYQKLQHRGFNGDGRTDRASLQDSVSGRPLYQKLQHRGINGDGRPLARYSRASLHGAVTAIVESEGTPSG